MLCRRAVLDTAAEGCSSDERSGAFQSVRAPAQPHALPALRPSAGCACLVHVAAGRQVERDTLVHDLVRGRGFSQVGVCDAAVHGAGRAGATDGGVGRSVWWVSVGVEEAGVHSRVHVGCRP